MMGISVITIGEDVERTVIFNYKRGNKNSKSELPKKTRKSEKDEHYTIVRLRKLEKKNVFMDLNGQPCEKDSFYLQKLY